MFHRMLCWWHVSFVTVVQVDIQVDIVTTSVWVSLIYIVRDGAIDLPTKTTYVQIFLNCRIYMYTKDPVDVAMTA